MEQVLIFFVGFFLGYMVRGIIAVAYLRKLARQTIEMSTESWDAAKKALEKRP